MSLPPITRQNVTITPEVLDSLRRLIRKCPQCGGYNSQHIVLAGGFKVDVDGRSCAVCNPVRRWVWDTFGVCFEELT